MDSTTPTPPTPAAPAPGPPNPLPTRRSAQVALAAFLAVLLGLLAFRGYGTRLGARPTEPVTTRFDLNRADRAELEQIPGVGPKLAQAIDDHRREKGPFQSVDQLRDVKGVGPVILGKVRPFLRVESSAAGDNSAELEPLVLERKKPAAPTKAAPAYVPAAGVRKLRPGDPPINVNTATVGQLQQLPSIGPTLAQRIIDVRTAAPFASADDLRRVKGIGAKTLESLRPFVVVE